MIRSIRARLKLSQADFAALVNVSPQSVLQWEHKEGRLAFLGQTKAAIIEVRKMKVREAKRRLQEIKQKSR